MEKGSNIIRSSIHCFLCNYYTFAYLAAILILPYSAANLLSKSLVSSSLSSSSSSSNLLLSSSSSSFSFNLLLSSSSSSNLLLSSSSNLLFTILTLKLSQTTLAFLFALPFALTFLVLSKAYIISASRRFPQHRHALPSFSAIPHLYPPLLLTQLFTSFILLSANAAAFSLLFAAFRAAASLGVTSRSALLPLSGAGAVLYSTIVTNAAALCNLASIVSAMENCSGYAAVRRACSLARGRVSVALSLALCTNLATVAVEALFQMRVARPYRRSGAVGISLVCEASIIAYMHSVISVVEIIITCIFYQRCRSEMLLRCQGQFGRELEPEEKCEFKTPC